LYVVIGSLLITTCVVVTHAYWPSAKMAIHVKASDLKPVDVLSMAFVLLFFFTAARETYITVWRQYFPSDFPNDINYYGPLIVFRYWLLVAAIMVLKAMPNLAEYKLLHTVLGWPRITIAVASGLILAIVLVNT
jgi:hypothetical protein